ncbi:acyl-CoA-like ligand-binding transcription factor [Actinomadura parmotrematis]|uniref:TetR family transcriptional regulator n=1 Tax=Actinomadura parmotrematis TaxID=2864039 RepID=A0ABS7G4N7_9ACTN|nr:TetR family transcriptional regulator [Actinomadura parmotrematis]MBW8487667.1 TetR family transcriptional regulator [Actinomadura parmotrematis]
MTVVEMGLRERKKAATRRALSLAALRLACRRGIDGVTVEDVAAEAGVSPRTFHNYFADKEEAIVAPLTDGAREVVGALRARPAGEPVWESLRRVVHAVLLPADTRAETLALLRLVKADPQLVARQLCGLGEMQRQITAEVAARTGTDPHRDLYPHLLAGAAGLAIRSTVDLWLDRGSGDDLPDLIDEAFARLRAGLPGP